MPELNIPKGKEGIIYAEEAELLNVAVFGCTAKEWNEINANKVLRGENIRDNADDIQLIALSNSPTARQLQGIPPLSPHNEALNKALFFKEDKK